MSKTTLSQKIVNLIYPIECLGCGVEGDWLCLECFKKHQRLRLENCFICAKAATTGICRDCQEKTGLDGIISLLPYRFPEAQALIRSAKYLGYHQALTFIVRQFGKKISRLLPEEFEHVSFVPITAARLKERGFNQAEIIAKALVEEGYTLKNVLTKIKETPSQTGLTKVKRQKNVKKAFAVDGQLPEHLLIVDDVITTGATLGALAKLAKRRGVKTVWAVTICHG